MKKYSNKFKNFSGDRKLNFFSKDHLVNNFIYKYKSKWTIR